MELYLGLNVVNEKEYLSAMLPVFLDDLFRSGSKKTDDEGRSVWSCVEFGEENN
tara:strand:- start:191 stop:352 length:162 start_codon:yes stop_codon:yes gene_type:complete